MQQFYKHWRDSSDGPDEFINPGKSRDFFKLINVLPKIIFLPSRRRSDIRQTRSWEMCRRLLLRTLEGMLWGNIVAPHRDNTQDVWDWNGPWHNVKIVETVGHITATMPGRFLKQTSDLVKLKFTCGLRRCVLPWRQRSDDRKNYVTVERIQEFPFCLTSFKGRVLAEGRSSSIPRAIGIYIQELYFERIHSEIEDRWGLQSSARTLLIFVVNYPFKNVVNK